jgi:hypothetical protein
MKVSRGTWEQRGGSVRLTGNMTGHDATLAKVFVTSMAS